MNRFAVHVERHDALGARHQAAVCSRSRSTYVHARSIGTELRRRRSTRALGSVGDDTSALLDQLDGGRLLTMLDIAGVHATRESARMLLRGGDHSTAKALLDVESAKAGLPPAERSSIAALLSWAEHGLGSWDRARDLLIEAALIVQCFPTPLATRDFVRRRREINLWQQPGPLPSHQNDELSPPNA